MGFLPKLQSFGVALEITQGAAMRCANGRLEFGLLQPHLRNGCQQLARFPRGIAFA
ncbi:hypothetical protein D3C85_1655290 [compost metagenome]